MLNFRGVFIGPNRHKEVVSAETSTPRARAFIDALLAAPWFDVKEYSLTAREVRAIVTDEPIAEITRPRLQPPVDVLEDLWQLSHLTSSYVGRACSAAILLAYGMLENSAISIVLAALFMPFLSEVLALSFGLWVGDRGLAKQGLVAISVSIVTCVGAGAMVAWLHGGPLIFPDFKRPLVSFCISLIIGIAAGLAVADDAGRRYLISVAAAVQYSVFPVWIGISLIRGFPDSHTVVERIGSFAVNIVTIASAAVITYVCTGIRRRDLERFRTKAQ